MYITISTIGTENIKVGDPVVVKYDCEFGRIGGFGIDGRAYGYMPDSQPYGCVDGWTMYSRIGDFRVIARCAAVKENVLLLSFDNPRFAVGSYARGAADTASVAYAR